MVALRDCSTSYTFTQVRARLAARLMQSHELPALVALLRSHGASAPATADTTRRAAAWRLAYVLLPQGNERAARPRSAAPVFLDGELAALALEGQAMNLCEALHGAAVRVGVSLLEQPASTVDTLGRIWALQRRAWARVERRRARTDALRSADRAV